MIARKNRYEEEDCIHNVEMLTRNRRPTALKYSSKEEEELELFN
jgi:hypothetical protein